MSYISLSDKDKKEMMSRIGISNPDELFRTVPGDLRLKHRLNLPDPLSEPELIRCFQDLAGRNTYSDYLSFLGAGAYHHFIPSVVDHLSSRGEFVSPYTPYQPEISQGTLQLIFEFQTLICQLTGMDIANASLYDGATGAAEAVLMAHRLKGKSRVLVSRALHPEYRAVIRTYTRNMGIEVEEIGFAPAGSMNMEELEKKLNGKIMAVVCQSPNFLGVIEDLEKISEMTHARQALFIVVVTEAMSLGLLEAPGRLGADIVTGEGQSFGLPLSYGGPYLGFMACCKDCLRHFPGRIAGETRDMEGKRGFVLTLSTREQHIRRERATSNICTNQALCALRATIFLETVGKEGLRELAEQNVFKAHYALRRLAALKGVEKRFAGKVFNEFVLEFSRGWPEVEESLKKKSIIAGLGLEEFYPELRNCALLCVTEMHGKDDIDRLIEGVVEVSR